MARELAIDYTTGLPLRDSRGRAIHSWQIMGIRRWPLKTPYSVVIPKVLEIATRDDIRPAPKVVVDMTGVGAAVFEQVCTELRLHEQIEVYGISITAGSTWAVRGPRMYNVSKVELTSCLAESLGCRRVKLCPRANGRKMDNAAILEKELRDFKIKTTKTGTQTAAAFNSDHDDCVMSISMPIWLGNQNFMRMGEWREPSMTTLQRHEVRALEVEDAKQQADDAAAELCEMAIHEERQLASWQVRVNEEMARDPWNEKHWRV
jgi:hypothetical protein